MLIFIARRLLLAVPVLLGVVFVVMLTVELIPGDAVALMLGDASLIEGRTHPTDVEVRDNRHASLNHGAHKEPH